MQIRCTQGDHRNQSIIGCCIDNQCLNQRPYCNSCLPNHIEHLNKLISLEVLDEWIQQRILCVQNVKNNVIQCKLSIDSLITLLIPYLNFNIQQYSEIGISQIDNLIKGLTQVEKCEQILFKQLEQSIQQSKNIIDQILKNLKTQTNQKEKNTFSLINFNRKPQILENPSIFKENLDKFTFEIINENTIKQNDLCYAFDFNNDQSIVLAGCANNIQIFQHYQGQLNQIQLLKEHKDRVLTLNFMKKTNNFVSGSRDNSIIIWQVIRYQQWNSQQILNGHSDWIFCLLLNNTDDLIISGSRDKTIKFQMKQNNKWLCSQTITDHTDWVYSLSLNEQQNKLISCSQDKQILIIEQSNLNKQWSVKQKIQVDEFGIRLCFINDNEFTFQPYTQEQMHIYELDTINKQYRKTKQIAVQCGSIDCDCLFPQQYLKSKCLLINKNGKNINIIQKKQNGDFIVLQSIQFDSYYIYGELSGDGEYLITWDGNSKTIQIRENKKL
ncbi:unnamed protein product [Paramecium sonneborni]|uniref:WD40-repeat-containing domain n=1 Tax=Paramecium sonneborni TaxID=65129 RepID=A0A8S1RCB9_9CILI|nr:unnamed protein product [Paramecium sonneborni]